MWRVLPLEALFDNPERAVLITDIGPIESAVSCKPMHTLPSQIEVVSDEMAAILRHKTGAERLEIASRMFGSARRMLINHLGFLHPDWNDSQIEREAARRLSHGAV